MPTPVRRRHPDGSDAATGDQRAIPFLNTLLTTNNGKIRKEALRSLARLGDETARKHLVSFSLRPDVPAEELRLARSLVARVEGRA